LTCNRFLADGSRAAVSVELLCQTSDGTYAMEPVSFRKKDVSPVAPGKLAVVMALM